MSHISSVLGRADDKFSVDGHVCFVNDQGQTWTPAKKCLSACVECGFVKDKLSWEDWDDNDMKGHLFCVKAIFLVCVCVCGSGGDGVEAREQHHSHPHSLTATVSDLLARRLWLA